MKLRVFLADVDQVLADVLNASLAEREAEIKSVDRGSLALMELKDFKPHVALLNANLKGISGYDLCEMIKQDSELSHAKVVLIDSEENPLNAARAEEVEYDAHLRRPYSVDNVAVLLEGLGVEGFDQETVAESAEETGNEGFFDLSAAEASASESEMIFEVEREGADKGELLHDEQGSGQGLAALDEEEAQAEPEAAPAEAEVSAPPPAVEQKAVAVEKKITLEEVLSQEAGKRIVQRIVEEMSDDVVREIAWEVVPELAERIIQETIETLKKKKA